jgi:short subunit dehydrogenase-like uncharacterized protein
MAADTSPLAKQMAHPYYLDPNYGTPAAADLPDKGGAVLPAYSTAGECWAGPFVMAAHNEKIVRRSNAQLGYAYGVSSFAVQVSGFV